MRCFYEVLEVARDADDATIRMAYKKAALKCHPDKNQGDSAAAEERFKEVRNAYEILGDAHERSWYDKHRDAILNSGERYQSGSSASPTPQRPADEVNLYQYFTPSAYSGFGDGPGAFYAVYAAVFETLAKQEARAREQGTKKGGAPVRVYPAFGNSVTPWPEVAAFYAAWGGFTTAKDFAWTDQYNPAAAPNRRTRRMVEAENEKVRRAARREFNEGVRELVAFMKKRDRRVTAHAKEEAARRAEQAALDQARREQERQERQARAQEYREAAWMRAEEGEGASPSGSDEESVEDVLDWECVVCEKHFKSERAFHNHERSKKHRDAVDLLREVMNEEEAALVGDALGDAGGGDATSANDEGAGGSPAHGSAHGATEDAADPAGARSDEDVEATSTTRSSEAGGSSVVASDLSSEEGPPSEAVPGPGSITSSEEEEEEEEDEMAMLSRLLETQRVVTGRNGRSRRRAAVAGVAASRSGTDSDSEGSASGSGMEGLGVSETAACDDQSAHAPDSGAQDRSTDDGAGATTAMLVGSETESEDWATSGRPHQKRRGRGARQVGGVASSPASVPLNKQAPGAPAPTRRGGGKKAGRHAATVPHEGQEDALLCKVCSAVFASRSKLFKHIATAGHAAPRT